MRILTVLVTHTRGGEGKKQLKEMPDVCSDFNAVD